ncbi:MAG TPA: ATP-dependent zinc metalloprotease FtsH [Gaiellaceae bacterium]|jgi:cell division protease FtsH|nr:ATP-dependent zinc metalloprotease FtsH [Gaiellaceae bacterium]
MPNSPDDRAPATPPPAPRGSSPTEAGRPWFRPSPRWIVFFLAVLALNVFVASRAMEPESRVRVPYSPFFLQQVKTGNVEEITSKGTDIQGTFTKPLSYKDSKPTTRFRTEVPAFADTDELSQLLQQNDVTVNAEPLDTGAPWWQTLVFGFGPTILFVFLLFWLFRRAGNVQNALGSFGRSRARRYEPSGQKVTFGDVAGIDEAKEELTEVVDFLRNPDKYRKLGGRIPHGVLLAGPPGTGKTLLARAVAGEADVPFFSMAASEFVEAIVGVGAARVRDLFKEAKEDAPAIVFIDELDAIGRSRTSGIAGFSGGNDEREQTLNQILTEMDGFDSATSVIVIGATNRPDVLDPALLRPGRFDRRVAVQPPDRAGREAILRVHTRGVPLGPDVDLARIAATAPGMVGADLANLVNEAALTAARRGHEVVEEEDFTDALERIVLGAERRVMLSDDDRRRTAYHEAGHAIVGMLTPRSDPVRKVSIIPRGMALGVTFSAPDADRFNYLEPEVRAKIKVALGGRAAEETVFGEISTGAESDIEQLTALARQMVGRWGMSDALGPVSVIPRDGSGPFIPGSADVSPETQRLLDQEVRRIVAEAHDEVVMLLKENRGRLDSLAEALLEHETLDEDDAYAAAGVARAPEATVGELATAARSFDP